MAERVARLAAEEARALVWACAGELDGAGQSVLEVMERAAQEASARIGCQVVAGVVGLAGQDAPAAVDCASGHRARLVQRRPKVVRSLLGELRVTRGYYHCGVCGEGFAPLDARLGVTRTGLSPGLARACALAGAEMPYAKSQDFIAQVSGLELASASTINRVTVKEGARARNLIGEELGRAHPGPVPAAWHDTRPDKCYIVLDGTGAPMLPCETRGRAGKQTPQAGTREVKIGCFFTQSGPDEDAQPVQDPASVSHISTFEPAHVFSDMVKAEYYRRGFDQVRQPVVIGDGAKWIWAIADERLPHATQIVDYYHAREHLATLTSLLTPLTLDPDHLASQLADALDHGHTQSIADLAANLDPPDDLVHAITVETGYFTGNHHRMQYHQFKQQGYFIGSGSVESACNTIVKQRAKRAGMHWTINGLDPVIALRTLNQSNRLNLIWKQPTSRHTRK